ncbi:uncharacterized protein LOC104265558 [Ciona intestinalis]
MKVLILTSFLSMLAVVLLACELPERPKFGRMRCINTKTGLTCKFKCNSWANMIGQPVITCDRSNQWNAPAPICHPDYYKCRKSNDKRCPKITKSDMRKFREHRNLLSKAQVEAIQRVELTYASLRTVRTMNKKFCVPDMCHFYCPNLLYRKLANRCRTCKKKKIIKCNKYGSILG